MWTDDAIRWLIAAADVPERCEGAWRRDPCVPHLLAAGRSFDVVAVDEELGARALRLLRTANLPLSPVMADQRTRQVGFFLPHRSQEVFTRALADAQPAGEDSLRTDPPKYRYLGLGSYVVVPGPTTLDHSRYVWVLPATCGLVPIAPALGRALVASADRPGAAASVTPGSTGGHTPPLPGLLRP